MPSAPSLFRRRLELRHTGKLRYSGKLWHNIKLRHGGETEFGSYLARQISNSN
jgi:hypothetical protein